MLHTPDYRVARERMVNRQLMPRGITDKGVLEAIKSIPRHLFMEEALIREAYSDHPLPIGHKQTISQPYIVALMTQALQLSGEENVLEIGTGCGYQTAILAQLADRVYSVERIKSLHIKARRTLDRLKYVNVVCKIDDGTLGWPSFSPFEAIMVTAASPDIPAPLLDQLADPGRMVIPVGDRYSQLLVVVKKQDGEITKETIEQVRFVSLIGMHGWQE